MTMIISNQTIAYFIQPLNLKAERPGPGARSRQRGGRGVNPTLPIESKFHENRPVVLQNMSDPLAISRLRPMF